MDIFIPIIICVILFVMISICGWCCKKKREGTVYGPRQVTITTTTMGASPIVVPPYPVAEPSHPTPHSGAPAPGFAPYPTTYAPYPNAGTSCPYPPGMQAPPPMSSYPPPPPQAVLGGGPTDYYHAGQQHPPPYSEVVAQPPPPQTRYPPVNVNEGYAKQAPYNPNY